MKSLRMLLIMTFAMAVAFVGLADATVQPVEAAGEFMWPADGTITSGFRPPNRPNHHGIDIAKSGTVPIYASAAGTVSRSYLSSSYGEVVFIKHTINGVNYETVYAHMRSGSRTVKEGDKVAKGARLGYMGATGDATGQHLHFELHRPSWNIDKSNAVNPLNYLPSR